MNYKKGLDRLFGVISMFLGIIIGSHFVIITSNSFRGSVLNNDENLIHVLFVFFFWFVLTHLVIGLAKMLLIWIIDGFIEKA